MSIIALRRIEKAFGSWSLFRHVDLEVGDRARIGVVGPNGSGKSTLLRILSGTEPIEGGQRTHGRGVVTAYLPQQLEGDRRTALQTVLASRPDVAELGEAIRSSEAELTAPGIASDLRRMQRVIRRQEELMERWVAAGGPGLEGEIRSVLGDLGLDDAVASAPTSALSGGERKLVWLAACLIRRPTVLLLDEPESHLDTTAREALERVIRSFDGAVVVVSHDRHLLDETVSEIVEVERGGITVWPGNYSAYAVARDLALKRQQQDYVTQQKEIARLEDAVRRFRAWFAIAGDHRNIVQARQKERQIDRMDRVERPVLERRRMALALRPSVRGGQKVGLVRAAAPMFEQEAVNLLGRYLFRYDQMRGPASDLSGGERTRLELLLLSLSGANCLVLDEPTNHLDIESLEVLEGELERFDGTAIVISHDRYFLERIPDRVVEVTGGGVRLYGGGYADWAERRFGQVPST